MDGELTALGPFDVALPALAAGEPGNSLGLGRSPLVRLELVLKLVCAVTMLADVEFARRWDGSGVKSLPCCSAAAARDSCSARVASGSGSSAEYGGGGASSSCVCCRTGCLLTGGRRSIAAICVTLGMPPGILGPPGPPAVPAMALTGRCGRVPCPTLLVRLGPASDGVRRRRMMRDGGRRCHSRASMKTLAKFIGICRQRSF